MPNIQYFTPDVSQGVSAGPAAVAFAIPNTADALLYIFNMGPTHIFFKLSTTALLAVSGLTASTGCPVLAGQALIVGAAGMSYIGMLNSGGQGGYATVNLTSGS